MSTYDPLAAVQDESVNAAANGVVVSSQGLAIETSFLPKATYSQNPNQFGLNSIPWPLLLLGAGLAGYLVTSALYPKGGDEE